jgi:hypothetical protein
MLAHSSSWLRGRPEKLEEAARDLGDAVTAIPH